MILTVGMSPCVDITAKMKKFTLGKTNTAGEKSVTYAGKANNVATGITRLGGKAFVTGFMYNENGSLFEQALDKEGIPFSFIWNPGRVRENYKFIDANGTLTEVNEEGKAVTKEKLRELLDFVRIHSPRYEAAVISGGAPKGTPASYYKELVQAAKGAPLIVADTYGERLKAALEAGVDLIKPNLDELTETFGREFSSREELLVAVRELIKAGAKNVLLSLGSEGAMLVNENEAYYCKAESVTVESSVGAGDAMVAAATMALTQGLPSSEVLRRAVAAGTASVTERLGNSFKKETYDVLYEKTHAEAL
ncbi:MAG: 1-phosphofructokinase family hexose kinase [Candidatus Borkfalkiaceae bacterium]|nr:1-phosphofructokinase family hexose kinase [Clostridia bacterium]MDY6222948.1 1-phosphofructokinase family hexose kinase [Christensenellaceae bacterium]